MAATSLRASASGVDAVSPATTTRARLAPVAFAVALFLLQVLPFLSYRWVTDESWYAATGYSIAHGSGVRNPSVGPNDMESRFDARPPGTALVAAGFFRAFGTNEISARAGSVIAGVCIVLLVYAIARVQFGDGAAMLAALCIATDNFVVLTSRTARPEALTVMCVLFALWLLQRYWKRGDAIHALASGLALAAGTMFHITLLGWIVSLLLLSIGIDRQRRAFPLRGALLLGGGYLLGLLPFVLWILTAPLGRLGFRDEYLKRASGDSLFSRLLLEGHRYLDLLGLHVAHTAPLSQVPLRLPIPLLLLLLSYLLWRWQRSWFYVELALLLPSMLWLVYTVNKSSRYLVLLAPTFAFLLAAAFAASLSRPRVRRFVVGAAVFIFVAQTGANLLLLRAAHQANYEHLAAQLRGTIPEGAAAYGTITYWLALDQHPYISYERTSPLQAAAEFHTRYFILGDRTMMNGGDWDSTFYDRLQRELASVVSRSTLVGSFSDPYYGETKVYRLDR